MAQGDKSAYYQALKRHGFTFDKHYREYTTDELKRLWAGHAGENEIQEQVTPPAPKQAVPERPDEVAELRAQLAQVAQAVNSLTQMVTPEQRRAERTPVPQATAERPSLDPSTHAGVTLNSHPDGEVLEVDEFGNKWYQKEVTKPGFAKPRGRRVLKYDNPGVTKEQIKVGEYVETFEVAGDPSTSRPAEIKVTLPSFQTGIYLPKGMPFRVHTYNGVRGFSLRDVQNYYGGSDLVPSTIKKCYVSTDLCFDITSTIRTIENEYRERVLKADKGL